MNKRSRRKLVIGALIFTGLIFGAVALCFKQPVGDNAIVSVAANATAQTAAVQNKPCPSAEEVQAFFAKSEAEFAAWKAKHQGVLTPDNMGAEAYAEYEAYQQPRIRVDDVVAITQATNCQEGEILAKKRLHEIWHNKRMAYVKQFNTKYAQLQ